MGQHQAPGGPHHPAQRQPDHPVGGRPAGEPGLRHRSSQLRDEQLLHQPGAGADRAVHQGQRVRQRGLRAAQAPRRDGGPFALGSHWRQAHRIEQGPGRLHQRAS